jgi:hypothetical protein
MNIKQLNKSNLPIIRLDRTLEIYKGKVLFKDKVEKANLTLKSVGLPKVKNCSK